MTQTPYPLDVLVEAAEAAVSAGGVARVGNMGVAIHVVHDGEIVAQTSLGEDTAHIASLPLTLDYLRGAKAAMDAHAAEDHSPEEIKALEAPAPVAAIEAAPAAEDDEKDWLSGAAACAIENGDECEACQ